MTTFYKHGNVLISYMTVQLTTYNCIGISKHLKSQLIIGMVSCKLTPVHAPYTAKVHLRKRRDISQLAHRPYWYPPPFNPESDFSLKVNGLVRDLEPGTTS
uniref:Uncharacterized protein n=1 Tax=Strigamia maritima TaxID=126957 RepID=T1JLU2_STRMM